MTSYEDAIFAAAKTGSVEDIQELLKTNVNWNTKDSLGNTPVHYAAVTGHAEVVKLLAQSKKADFNAQNSVGETPLHKVAGVAKPNAGHLAAVQALVDGGASLDVKNTKGELASDIAVDGGLRDAILANVVIPGYDPEADDDDDNQDEDESDEEDDE